MCGHTQNTMRTVSRVEQYACLSIYLQSAKRESGARWERQTINKRAATGDCKQVGNTFHSFPWPKEHWRVCAPYQVRAEKEWVKMQKLKCNFRVSEKWGFYWPIVRGCLNDAETWEWESIVDWPSCASLMRFLKSLDVEVEVSKSPWVDVASVPLGKKLKQGRSGDSRALDSLVSENHGTETLSIWRCLWHNLWKATGNTGDSGKKLFQVVGSIFENSFTNKDDDSCLQVHPWTVGPKADLQIRTGLIQC